MNKKEIKVPFIINLRDCRIYQGIGTYGFYSINNKNQEDKVFLIGLALMAEKT